MTRRVYLGVRTAITTLCCAASLVLAGTAAAQTTVVLDSPGSEVVDTSIRGGSYASTNYDKAVLFTRASTNAEYLRRALLKFNTETYVPKGARIQSAKLTLTVKGGNAPTRTISAYRVVESFDAPAATWKQRKSSLAWKTTGGAYGSRYATASVSGTPGSTVTFDVTTLVQEVVNGTYGSRYTRIALLDQGSSTNDSYKEFYNSEASSSSVRPRLTVVYGGSTSGSTTTSGSSTSGSTTGVRLKFFHYNLHHGVGTDGRYDIERIANVIAKANPDVVSLNEVEKYTGWGNEDQPRRYEQMLEAKTGRTWYAVWAQEYGQWSSNGKGNLLLSRYPFSSTARYELSYERTIALGQITVNGRNITVATTHLDPESETRRTTQAKQMVAWLSGFAENRIVGGDMNGQPTSSSMTYVKNTYHDGWQQAKNGGYAYSPSDNPNGYTRNSRIDYIFTSKYASHLVPIRFEVIETRDANGVMPSDHRPIMITYTVK